MLWVVKVSGYDAVDGTGEGLGCCGWYSKGFMMLLVVQMRGSNALDGTGEGI